MLWVYDWLSHSKWEIPLPQTPTESNQAILFVDEGIETAPGTMSNDFAPFQELCFTMKPTKLDDEQINMQGLLHRF